MNEIIELIQAEIIKGLPTGSKEIEFKNFDYQMKEIHFKYKIGRKREKGSILLTVKS